MIFDQLSMQLENCLKECKNLLGNSNCDVLIRQIENIQDRLRQPMQLAIIGKISSSKSTIVNAILGEPEVVRTGQMEETYNVSWLKYGPIDSDIRVVFKDGSAKEVPKNHWSSWTSHQIQNSLRDNVKYIEVFYPNEILKYINIIDTPGLDALSQIDSLNTIHFLKDVHPDAVVMVFTKSIAESTMSVLQDFQSSETDGFNLNPLNALGVLAKVDMMWNSFDIDKDIIKDCKRVIETTLYDRYPEVRKSLFTILPISALLGLSASMVSEEDIQLVKILSKQDDNTLAEMLSSPDFLLDESYNTGLSTPQLMRLYDTFGLYGIYLIVKSIRCGECSITDIKSTLSHYSGFSKLIATLQSHFGDRAVLIKCRSSIAQLIKSCIELRQTSEDTIADKIGAVIKKITSFIISLVEFEQWEYLAKIYNNQIDVSDDIIKEFKDVCGENGASIWERLNIREDKGYDDIIKHIHERAHFWQREYNMFSIIDPERASLSKVLINSYVHLETQINELIKETKVALNIVERSESFFGVENIKRLVGV